VGVEPVPEVAAELLRRVAALPKLDIRPTIVSLPGAKGLWLLEDMPLVRPEVIVGGREFAHIHPDGSLHASLPPQRAAAACRRSVPKKLSTQAGRCGILGPRNAQSGWGSLCSIPPNRWRNWK
ncbi:MAG: hypothetical protein HOI95_06320, partial [Chromatiales bacterium]|nr:hypothetical protein [Chromatiales bacterium]